MAPRYLIVFDTDRSRMGDVVAGIHPEAGLRRVLETETLSVLASNDASPLVMSNRQGAVIGHVFSGIAPTRRVSGFSERDSEAIGRSRGQILVDQFWGGYVAIIPVAGGNAVDILRDPSGAMPCYYTSINGGHTRVIASDLETLVRSGLFRPTIDWEVLPGHLVAYDLRTPRTCLKNLSEVMAGNRLTLGPNGNASATCWSPKMFAECPEKGTLEDISRKLEEVASGTIAAWHSAFEHPLLGVSGGLDSSIVAAVLAASGRPASFFTMATGDAAGDERQYARTLGQGLGVDIFERFYELDQVDVRLPTSRHLPRPLLCAFGQSEQKQKLAIAAERGADAIFLGVGGDNVFCNLSSASPFLDRLLTEGPGSGAWRTARDTCRLTGCSLFELGIGAIRRAVRGRQYAWTREIDFLTPGAAATVLPPHPWLSDSAGLLPGKLAHIAMLTRIQGTIDGFSRFTSPPMVLPLLSQPLVEFCLSVPAWRWIEGGRNRSPARRAFASVLPKAILDRRSKGTPNSFAYDVIDRNRSVARDQLLNGILAANGLLDVEKTANTLAENVPLKGFDHMRMSILLEAEAWCRQWS